ncbi:hypothetical protein BC835DRAFT_1307198 [Cytidiella melzeri]|nr:hypothetical protein BC835DRAFT_1307198 [Cytidiella melzeri]
MVATKQTLTRTSTSNNRSEGEAAMDGSELNVASSRLRRDRTSNDTQTGPAIHLDSRVQAKASAKKHIATETALAEKWGLSKKAVGREGTRITRIATAKALAKEPQTEDDFDHNVPLAKGEQRQSHLKRYPDISGGDNKAGLSTPTVKPMSTEMSETTTESPPMNSDDNEVVEEMLNNLTIYDAAIEAVKVEEPDENWIQPRQKVVNTVVMNKQLAIPEEWKFLLPTLPELPTIRPEDLCQDREMSPNNDLVGFAPAYMDADEARLLGIAVRRSLSEGQPTRPRNGEALHKPVHCMATVVEIEDAPELPEDEVNVPPSGSLLTEPREQAEGKGKGVDRDPSQTEFLRRYDKAQGKNTPSDQRHQSEGAKFKREALMVPEGGWFHSKCVNPTQDEPEDGSSSDSSSSSSSSASSSSSRSINNIGWAKEGQC